MCSLSASLSRFIFLLWLQWTFTPEPQCDYPPDTLYHKLHFTLLQHHCLLWHKKQISNDNTTVCCIHLPTHTDTHSHTRTHQHRLPNWPSKSGGEWNKDVLLWAWRSAPRAWPSAAGRAQQEDREMRSAQLLKPASCRQTRHHAGTGSSHERQSTKIAKYCYDCRRVCCSVWELRNSK